MTKMREMTVTITNVQGFHARAAVKFVHVASQFEANVFVVKDGREVSGTSILGLMTMVATINTKLLLRAKGRDAGAALAALGDLVASKFGEQ